MLIDEGKVTKNDKTLVVDRYKVRRWKKKMMNLLCVRRKKEVSETLTSVYFDSKQCKLLVQKLINGKVRTVTSKEDLYVLVQVGFITWNKISEKILKIFWLCQELNVCQSFCVSVCSAQSCIKNWIFTFFSQVFLRSL